MAISAEILRSWRSPRAAIRRILPAATEAGALSYLLAAAILLIVAQAPGLARQAHLDPAVPVEARLFAAALGILAFLPPAAYGLAALSHLVARAFAGRGTWLGARLALFWTLLALAPLFLLRGLIAGLAGVGTALSAMDFLVTAAFLAHWILALTAAEQIGIAE